MCFHLEHMHIFFPISYVGLLKRFEMEEAEDQKELWRNGGSNSGPSACKADALPLSHFPYVRMWLLFDYLNTLLKKTANATLPICVACLPVFR